MRHLMISQSIYCRSCYKEQRHSLDTNQSSLGAQILVHVTAFLATLRQLI